MTNDINNIVDWIGRHPKFVHYVIYNHNHRGKPSIEARSLSGERHDSESLAEAVKQELQILNG